MPTSAVNSSRASATSASAPSASAGPRGLSPEDLYALRVPTDVRLTPDGRLAVFVLQAPKPGRDGYTHSLWIVPTDGSTPPRQLTIGAGHDTTPRISPDGRFLAFLSDRRTAVEPDLEPAPAAKNGSDHRSPEPPASGPDREDGVQVYLLPLDGPGEARRLTDLPRSVDSFEWSPDGRKLAVLSASVGATREEDRRLRDMDDPAPTGKSLPRSDYRYLDRLSYIHNGHGFVYDRRSQLWLVDVESAENRRLTDVASGVDSIGWSPDSRKIAYSANDRDDFDFDIRSFVFVVDVETGDRTRLTDAGKVYFSTPTFLPDGRTVALLGHRFPVHASSRNDIWLFAADGSEAGEGGGRNLSGEHDLEIGSTMNSDVTVGEGPRLVPSSDGASITFLAPVTGSYELWRIAVSDGRVERLTEGREYLSGFDVAEAASMAAFIRSTPTELADVWVRTGDGTMRRVTSLNADPLAGVALVEPVERWYEADGRRMQGWLLEAPESSGYRRPGPLVVEIHGGPQTQYGWSPFLEFQVLAATGISVWYCNPRGSTGYGQDFANANFRDWGDGPMRDVLAGVDELVAEGITDPKRLGVTGGSYGGYLTNWIVGHDHRFRAALTARSVSDLTSLVLTGDLSGLDVVNEFGSTPWDDPEFYRQQSPITYVAASTTPLLIQHAEQDLRCAIGQAEELFGVLRANKRPVRLMRVPGESHELTRSGAPFRRAENLIQVRDWFRHFLVAGRRTMPPLPRERAGK